MKSLRKVLVITERGRVVGTQFVAQAPAETPAVSTALCAGPGQKLHELELEISAQPISATEIETFYKAIELRLQPKKPSRK